MPKRRTRNLAPRRATVPITGGTANVSASLDYASAVALRWAAAWASSYLHARRVSGTAVIRRALQHYVAHVEALAAEQAASRREAVLLASCSQALSDPGEQDLAGVVRMLREVKRGAPMPSYRDLVRPSPESTPWIAALRAPAPIPPDGSPQPRTEFPLTTPQQFPPRVEPGAPR